MYLPSILYLFLFSTPCKLYGEGQIALAKDLNEGHIKFHHQGPHELIRPQAAHSIRKTTDNVSSDLSVSSPCATPHRLKINLAMHALQQSEDYLCINMDNLLVALVCMARLIVHL